MLGNTTDVSKFLKKTKTTGIMSDMIFVKSAHVHILFIALLLKGTFRDLTETQMPPILVTPRFFNFVYLLMCELSFE